jgi:hypothetical protein
MSGRQDATSQSPADTCGPIAAVGQRRDDTRLRAANGSHQTQARALRLTDDRRPAAGGREIEAVPRTATVIPLQLGRALPADHQDLAEVSPTVPYTHHEQELELLDWTISNLFYVGLILLPAARQHSETAQETAEALQCLDDTICRLRDHVRNAHSNGC